MFILISVIVSALYVQVLSYDQYSKSSKSEPYFEVLMDRIVDIVNNGQLFDFSDLKVRKINKTRSFVGNIVINSPLGNDVTIEAVAYVKHGGDYKLMPYRISPTPFCEFAGNDTYAYPDLAKNSDFPVDIGAECPLQPRAYNVKGVVYRLDSLPKSIAQSGDYALEATLTRDGTVLNKLRIYATVIQV